MNKLITSSILIFCMLFFSACSLGGSRIKMLNGNRDDAKANERLEQVIEAVKNKDKVAIKSLFSKKALSEANDFDGSVDDLFEFIQGEVDTWKKSSGPTVFESNNQGSKKKKVDSYYYVNTDKQKYYFLLEDYPVDTNNPDNVGLYLLLVVKAENREKVYDHSQKILFDGDKELLRAGIYIPLE